MAEDQWSLKEYLPKNSPKRGFFRKNLAPALKPRGAHSFVAYVTFHFEPKDESGLPSAEDSDLLAKLEESAFVELEADGLAIQRCNRHERRCEGHSFLYSQRAGVFEKGQEIQISASSV